MKRTPLTITPATVAKRTHVAGKSPFLWDAGDGSCRGFYLRVTPAGGKQYGLQYTLAGKQRRLSLGPIQKWESPAQAREHARGLLTRLHQKRIDPAVGGDGTMQSVFERYLEGLRDGSLRRRKRGIPASPKTIADATDAWENHLAPALGSLTPAEITPALLEDVHRRISKPRRVRNTGRGSVRRGGLVTANRCVAYLRGAWKANKTSGLTANVPDPFVDGAFVMNAENPTRTVLDQADAPAFLTAVTQEDEPLRTYWLLSLTIGTRGSELRALTWEQIDLQSGRITFGVTKNGTRHSIVLPPLALDAMRNLREMFPEGSKPFEFAYPKASWQRILKRAGIANVRPHGLRHAFGQWMAAEGASALQIGAVLNHKSDVTAKVYANLAANSAAKTAAVAQQEQLIQRLAAAVAGGAP